jgi:protein gp37
MAARFSGPGQPYEDLAYFDVNGHAHWTGKVRLAEDKLEEPLRWKKPSRVFVNSMSDLFHVDVSDGHIDYLFAVMALARQHTFQVLTKRAERLHSYMTTPERKRTIAERVMCISNRLAARAGTYKARVKLDDFSAAFADQGPFPNIWVGVSVEDQQRADLRIPLLLRTPAAVRFLSCEPLLAPVILHKYLAECECGHGHGFTACPHTGGVALRCHHPDCPCPGLRPCLHWVIVGGESGPHARPCDVQWVRSLVEQCRAARVACFVKQLGARSIGWHDLTCAITERCGNVSGPEHGPEVPARLRDSKGGDMQEFPEDLRVRQFPRTGGHHA